MLLLLTNPIMVERDGPLDLNVEVLNTGSMSFAETANHLVAKFGVPRAFANGIVPWLTTCKAGDTLFLPEKVGSEVSAAVITRLGGVPTIARVHAEEVKKVEVKTKLVTLPRNTKKPSKARRRRTRSAAAADGDDD